MAKKQRKEQTVETPKQGAELASQKTEKAFKFHKISQSELQIVELTIVDGVVEKEHRREPDLPFIVHQKLIKEIKDM